jgi:endonuclease YncB( thermonuclease family)
MANFLSIIIFLLLPLVSASYSRDQSLPIVRFQGCYDGDTCATTEDESVRLACIDAPEVKTVLV